MIEFDKHLASGAVGQVLIGTLLFVVGLVISDPVSPVDLFEKDHGRHGDRHAKAGKAEIDRLSFPGEGQPGFSLQSPVIRFFFPLGRNQENKGSEGHPLPLPDPVGKLF